MGRGKKSDKNVMPDRTVLKYKVNTDTLYAFCDDGSVWHLIEGSRVWVMLPSVPGTAEEILAGVSNTSICLQCGVEKDHLAHDGTSEYYCTQCGERW